MENDIDPNVAAVVQQTRTRSHSSSSSINENESNAANIAKRRKSKQKGKAKVAAIRSITCVECGHDPAVTSLKAPEFESWSEKYFHVAESHLFKRFKCPYEPCNQTFRVFMKLNEHIDQTHPGLRRVAEPRGYHQDITSKIRDCFPVICENLEKPSKRKSTIETPTSDDESATLATVALSLKGRRSTTDNIRKSTVIEDQNSDDDVIEIPVTTPDPPIDTLSNGDQSSGPQVVPATDVPRHVLVIPVSLRPVSIVDSTFLLSTPQTLTSFPRYPAEIQSPTASGNIPTANISSSALPPTPVSNNVEVVNLVESESSEDDDEPFLAFPGYKTAKFGDKPPEAPLAQRPDEVEEDEEDFFVFPK